jgi:hypothetical protein
MKRMVLLIALGSAALVLTSSVATASTVPRIERVRIQALLAPYDYLPARLPSGLIYIRWSERELSPSVCGSALIVTFAGPSGNRVEWSASRACDNQGRVRCSASGYPGYSFGMRVDHRATINGRRVFFSQGNHGSTAWTCFPTKTGGFSDAVAIGIWESNFLTPRAAMQLVAGARRT